MQNAYSTMMMPWRRKLPGWMSVAGFIRCGMACVLFTLYIPSGAATPDVESGLQNDFLGAALAGEYALQAGRLDDALDGYLNAARAAPDDAALAERVAWIALFGNDDDKAAEALNLWTARVPLSLPIRSVKAQLALRQGKLRTARRELIALLKAADPSGWRTALDVLSRSQRDPAQLARLIGQLLDADALPGEWDAWTGLHALATGLNESVLAERLLQSITARFPDAPRLPLLHAHQLRKTGDSEQALAVLAAADETQLLTHGLGLMLAGEYAELGNYAKSESLLAREVQTLQVVAMRAWLFSQTGNISGLLALYNSLHENAGIPDPTQRFLLGQLAEHMGLFDDALDWYAAVPSGDERFQAQQRVVVILHWLGRGEEAYAHARALQDDPQQDASVHINAILLEANLRHSDDDPDGEAAAFARGLAIYPDAPELLYSRSLMWERRDDIARAEADLRLILVAQPDNTTALNALGYILADRTRRYDEALALIERARLAEPDNAAIIDSYGWVLYRLGRAEDALPHLRRAWSLFKDAEVAAHVAEVLWSLGRRDEARHYFDEAKAINPGHPALQRALEDTGA